MKRKRSTLAEVESTVASIDAALESAPPYAKAALFRARLDALDKIARLRGEHELTPAMVLRSKAWREVMSAIAPILEKHPDVAAEIADALEALEDA